MRYADIVIMGDPYENTYWVDTGKHVGPKGTPRYIRSGSSALDHLMTPFGDKSFKSGSSVLRAIDLALFSEWDDRLQEARENDEPPPLPATMRIVYFADHRARKRVVEEIDIGEHGVTGEYTPYGRRFARAKAVYPPT